jgi:hypothetical protein
MEKEKPRLGNDDAAKSPRFLNPIRPTGLTP